MMVDWNIYPSHIVPTLKNHTAIKSLRRQPRFYTDTSDFTRIDYGDVIHVDNRYFLVVGYTKEGRFGIDEQPKQWVPKVYDLESKERKIVKLVFHETFTLKFGGLEVKCYRSPEKEGKVLDLVSGNMMFMQGHSALDEAGNLVRILDVIRGKRLDSSINAMLVKKHRDYIEKYAEDILRKFLLSVEAIAFLHSYGFKHGDIRRDHIYIDSNDGSFRWIDFDYDFYLPERPYALDLIGLGNILLYILGRRNYRPVDVLQNPDMGEATLETLHVNDLSLLARDRIFNLRKLFNYIPSCFNDMLLRFSAGTTVMYDTVGEFYEDLANCIKEVYG